MNAIEEERDPYAVVLADLLAKRDQIDAAISALEALRGGLGKGQERPRSEAPPNGDQRLDAGAFLGMSIAEATKKLLAAKRRAMSNQEIANDLQAGGLVMNSADPQNTVGSVLTRRFNDVGDIVRVDRGTWGLATWYPGRNFKKAKATSETTDQQPPPAPAETSPQG